MTLNCSGPWTILYSTRLPDPRGPLECVRAHWYGFGAGAQIAAREGQSPKSLMFLQRISDGGWNPSLE